MTKFLLAISSIFLSATAMASDCVLPFTKMINSKTGTAFPVSATYNDFPNVKDMYRGRYLVMNLNTKDDNGNCKGIQEHYPAQDIASAIGFFPELANANDAQTYLALPHYKAPLRRDPIVPGNLCLGQTVTMCEMLPNGQVVEVAKLATSSLETGSGHPDYGYYSELSFIETRNWAQNRPAYTAADGVRDSEMGGVSDEQISGYRQAVYQRRWVMPNFLHVRAVDGYDYQYGNGFHELSQGETFSPNMGGPVSHGCLRLTRYGSVLLRWWVPRGARTFIHFTPEGYKKFAR